jgi:hypothetical protein
MSENWKKSRAEAEMLASGEKIMKEAREKASSQAPKKIKEMIYSKYFPSNYEIKYSDLPKDLKDDDVIVTLNDDGYYSENNSWDPFTRLEIHRYRDETDSEKEEREKREFEMKEELKKRRYESYLKLKAEFEK